MKRIFIGIIILMLALWIHPFVSLAIAAIYGFFSIGKYYELIFLGFVLDVIHQSLIDFSLVVLPLYTLISIIIFFFVVFINNRMNIYA